MLISPTIASLIGGVSQQPDAIRQTNQCELMENCWATVSRGLEKRPHFDHIKQLAAGTLGASVFAHFIDRGPGRRYLLTLAGTTARVFDAEDGTEKTVNDSTNAYFGLGAGAVADKFKVLDLPDYSLILNREAYPALGRDTTAVAPGSDFLIDVKSGVYSAIYIIKIVHNAVTYTATKTAHATDATDIRTSEIATDLLAAFAPALPADIVATRVDNTLRFVSTLFPMEITVNDSATNVLMGIVYRYGPIQRFNELPTVAVDGFVVKVIGEAATEARPYWVSFSANGSVDVLERGVWEETVNNYDNLSSGPAESPEDIVQMPLQLVENSDGTFDLQAAEWGTRGAGDQNTAPRPTFLGTYDVAEVGGPTVTGGFPIADIFLYRNRLGFISADNVFFSRHGDFFEVFPATVIVRLDTDTIDVKIAQGNVGLLRRVLVHQDNLILFTDRGQYALTAGETLAADSVGFFPLCSFDNDSDRCSPVALGDSGYFATTLGGYAGLRELYVDQVTGTADAANVTAHVPSYMPGRIRHMIGSTLDDVLMLIPEDETNGMYLYHFYWNGDEKLQGAWHRLVLDSTVSRIHSAALFGSALYVCVERTAGGTHIERMALGLEADAYDNDFQVKLDRRITEADCTLVAYSAITGLTTYTLPYARVNTMTIVVADDDGDYRFAETLPIVATTATTIAVEGNLIGVPVYIGVGYTMRYRFSKLYLRDQSNTALTDGRVQLKSVRVLYADTGYIRAEVTPNLRPMNTKTMTGHFIGDAFDYGDAELVDGTFQFAVLSQNNQVVIDLVNDSPLPSRLLSAEWRAEYSPRARKV